MGTTTGRARPTPISGRRAVGAVAVATLLAATLARAQEGGLTAVLNLSGGARLQSSDPGAGSERLTSGLGLDVTSQTRSQRLSFGVRGNLELDQEDGLTVRPSVSLGYSRNSRTTTLAAAASYARERVDGAVLVDDFTGPELVADDGIRTLTTASLSLTTGIGTPFGTDTRLSFSDRTYAETSDPDLVDQTKWTLSETLRFDVSPTLSLRLTGSLSETHTFDAEDTVQRSQRLGLGADIDVSPVWTVAADIGFADIETRRDDILGDRIVTTETGGEYSLTASREMENGALSFSAARSVNNAGGQTRLTASRSLETRTGSLSGTLGLIRFDDGGDTAVTADLGYARELSDGGSLQVSLSQSADTNADDQNVVRSRLAASLNRPLTATSSWSVTGSFARLTVVEDASDESLAELGVSYRHALTEDWDLSVGLSHRRSWEDGDEVNRTNVLSASIGRSFTFRP